MISLNIEKTFGFISKEKVSAYEAEVKAAQEMLEKGTGKGNDFLGWLHLPSSITKEHLADLNATAKVLRDNCEVVIVAGIGGSYLGARAVIEALSNSFTWLQNKKADPIMIYAGHNISEDYLYELTEYLKHKKFGVINISKPGVTKGEHWHNTKWEQFIVVSGHGLIQLRKEGTDEVLNYEVSGEKIQSVIMLPGYTHNIINLSDTEDLVTVMYCNEVFNPNKPDTYFDKVEK